MRKHYEMVDILFDGTIIDIESIGDFNSRFPDDDSRKYKDLSPTIFGYTTSKELTIFCAICEKEINSLKRVIQDELPNLKKPFYAFNASFEKCILHHSCNIRVEFEHELNIDRYEWKGNAVKLLGIDNYDDPFFDIGRKCKEAWEKGNFPDAIKHNKSCLLKERDIFLKRGRRDPDKLKLI